MRTIEQRREYRKNRYVLDPEFKEKQLLCMKKLYTENPKYKKQHTINHRKFSQTLIGKEIRKKANAKRKRLLGFKPINNYFKDSHAHHINKEQVSYIPNSVHKQFRHNHNKPESMIEINRIAFKYLTNDIKQL